MELVQLLVHSPAPVQERVLALELAQGLGQMLRMRRMWRMLRMRTQPARNTRRRT